MTTGACIALAVVGVVAGFCIGQALAARQLKEAANRWTKRLDEQRKEILNYIADVRINPKQYMLLTRWQAVDNPQCNIVLLGDHIEVTSFDATKYEALIPDFSHNCSVAVSAAADARAKQNECQRLPGIRIGGEEYA